MEAVSAWEVDPVNARHFARTLAALLLLAGSIAATSACAAGAGRLYVRIGPPAAIVEVVTVAPSPKHVWIAGYHRWNGSAYVWVPGRWEARPRPRARWVPGHWMETREGWFWVNGRWR